MLIINDHQGLKFDKSVTELGRQCMFLFQKILHFFEHFRALCYSFYGYTEGIVLVVSEFQLKTKSKQKLAIFQELLAKSSRVVLRLFVRKEQEGTFSP